MYPGRAWTTARPTLATAVTSLVCIALVVVSTVGPSKISPATDPSPRAEYTQNNLESSRAAGSSSSSSDRHEFLLQKAAGQNGNEAQGVELSFPTVAVAGAEGESDSLSGRSRGLVTAGVPAEGFLLAAVNYDDETRRAKLGSNSATPGLHKPLQPLDRYDTYRRGACDASNIHASNAMYTVSVFSVIRGSLRSV